MTERPEETGEPVEPVTSEQPAGPGQPPPAAAPGPPDRESDPSDPVAPETGTEVPPQPDPEALTEVTPGAEAGPVSAGGDEEDEATRLRVELAERTADLQRLQAEFVNYKRRVERDREMLEQNATYQALSPIVEVLDTIDRAREHGELEAGLGAVAEQLERTVADLGLTKFGEVGDAFDPELHDALSHVGEDPDATVTTCSVIAKSGYRIGDRVVRAAQVMVVDPPE